MNNENIDYSRTPRNSKALAGLILIAVGFIILVHQFNFFFFPSWLFSFPMLLIVIGLYIGAKHNFRNIAWIILVAIGAFNLVNDIFPDINFIHNFWPLIFILIGIKMILSRNRPWDKHMFAYQIKTRRFGQADPFVDSTQNPETPPLFFGTDKSSLGDDYLNSTSIFSGIKKKVLSKDFKGGEIVNIFGGADIDFTSADISGRVYLDIHQVFGGVKLIVPPHWHVTSDMVALFAGFDDKRIHKTDFSGDKVLVLRGNSFFAGVEIRSF